MKTIKLFLKPFKPVFIWAKKRYGEYRLAAPDNVYNAWAHTNEEHCFVGGELGKTPLISIVVPVYNPEHVHLQEMVYSVINQHYENWELILVNASDKPEPRKQTDDCANVDTRIKIVDPGKNLGIAANTNFGLEHAKGEYIAFSDHDDLLHPCALHAVAEQLATKDPPGVVYTDEDKVSADNERFFGPHFKDNYSPDLLRNVNYINHLTVIKADMVHGVNGLQAGYDGAQDYDLLLRVLDTYQPKVYHIPKVLYHWRASDSSTAQDISNKKYIFSSGEKAINDHIKRNKIPAKAKSISGRPGFYRLEYKPHNFSIIIGPTDIYQRPAAAFWISELASMTSKLPENISTQIIAGDWCKNFLQEKADGLTLISEDADYWKQAAQHVSHPVALCFQAAAMPQDKEDLVQLAAVTAATGCQAVSPLLVNKDRIIMNAGVMSIFGGFPKKFLEGYNLGRPTYHGSTEWARNPDDLATHLIAIKKDKLQELLQADRNALFSKGSSIGQLPATKGWQYLLWAHAIFEYMGMLTPRENDIHESLELARFRPIRTTRLDNWGNKYERSEK